MIYDKLWEIVERADWRLMIAEYKALAIGAFMVAAVLIWNRIRLSRRIRRIENQLKKMEKKISILEVQESRRLMRKSVKAAILERITAPQSAMLRLR